MKQIREESERSEHVLRLIALRCREVGIDVTTKLTLRCPRCQMYAIICFPSPVKRFFQHHHCWDKPGFIVIIL